MNPLSGLYGAAAAARNALFDLGLFRPLRLQRPVVSIGNLSVGGAGKTPFVIALGMLLQRRGIAFDVLSRGYGRTTRGVRVVDPDGKAAEFGDEPLLIARKLGAPVIVGERRFDAGRVAEEKFASQLHLLDDGFQHRRLARDVDIVLMTEADFSDRLLPVGRLREPLASLQRASMIVLPHGLEARAPLPARVVFRTTRDLVLDNVPTSPVVFCGLARPEQFFAQVRGAGIAPAAEVAFGDHHAYSERDIERLLGMQKAGGPRGFLTTEKDAVNLGTLSARLAPLSVGVLRVSIDRPEELVDTILTRVAERGPGS